MAELFTSGRVIDVILGLMLIEAVFLLLIHRRRRGFSVAQVAANLAAGAALLMAVRTALVRGEWRLIAAWLTIALVAHVWEMSLLWLAQGKETIAGRA